MGKPVIFAVDDDPEVLKAVGRDLQRRYGREYRVLRADSGQSALDTLGKVKLRNDPVALFLVDQQMPRMAGVEFLRKARELFPNAKRNLLTAYADAEAAIKSALRNLSSTRRGGGTERATSRPYRPTGLRRCDASAG